MMKSLVALAVACVLATPSAQAQDAGIKVGADAPPAAVQTLDGKPVNLESFYGTKPVVIEFWATWCPLCKKLEPALSAAKTRYAGQVTFVGIGVSSNQTAERQKEFVAKQGMGGEFVFDMDNMAQKAYAAPHTSYVVVLDSRKKVVYTGVGSEQDIDAAVRKAMGSH